MAFPLRTSTCCIPVRQNSFMTTSAAVIVLLACQHGDVRRYVNRISTLRCWGKRVLDVAKRIPGQLLGSAGTFLAGYLHTSLAFIRYIRGRSWPLLILWRCFSNNESYSTYPTEEAEQRYWDSAKVFRRRLQSSDARFCCPLVSSSSIENYENRIPVISAYQPSLPPLQKGLPRDKRCGGIDEEYYLPTKAFCKWYRMTFPDRAPLDPTKAARLKSMYTSDEKKEIHRLSRFKSNKKAFQTDHNLLNPRRYLYRDMWDAWQERHSGDVEIVFEGE
ncbi:hypothetical protein GYMLUDRAFT_59780 [Collybiopsis luxurians FD-317 M1]|uniref:Uncharacterized protein n=1 Tax=Collybiopsis luxurians FD-317 M1 TaxID=944289 RepID=A0A0D0CN24_9AGAR|nr:hypothetical protein GYMLUDRAFT_59780 [Collybiopsis luxurians FD-317 M1]